MSKSVLFIACILVLVSCSVSSDKETDKEIETVTGAHVDTPETQAVLIDPNEVEFYPDTCIGTICFYQSKNIEEYLGQNPMSRLNDNAIPSLDVLSSDKTQKLTIFFHPGSVTNEFSEFKISYNTNNEAKAFETRDREFITESEIKLGISIDKLKCIKGIPDSTKEEGTVLLRYIIAEFGSSKFLRRYNMPEYYASYKFEDGKLIEFQFGFEYP